MNFSFGNVFNGMFGPVKAEVNDEDTTNEEVQ